MIPLLLAACIIDPAFSVTPVVQWDQANMDFDLAGYEVSATEGPLTLIQRFPCIWKDLDVPPDGVTDIRSCRGADFAVALQRFLLGGHQYSITIRGYTDTGMRSPKDSAPITVCVPPTWDF